MSSTDVRQRFGSSLRRHREQRGMSQADLALAMDMPVDRLEEIEAGRAGFTSLDLRRAADALDVSLGDFFREPLQIDDQRFPDPSQREMVRFAASLHRDLDLVKRFGSSALDS